MNIIAMDSPRLGGIANMRLSGRAVNKLRVALLRRAAKLWRWA
jgi:hypothetical protein